nr:hypothetical protein [Tanacetum cinerariifolium]
MLMVPFRRIMSSITAQQAKLDLELVPKEKRLEIRKCTGRLGPIKIQKEPTFQVVLDALVLTLCYSIDKRKRFKLTLEIFRDIFKIYPRVQGQDFDAIPTDEENVSFLRDLGHTGKINFLNDVIVDHMHHSWRTFAELHLLRKRKSSRNQPLLNSLLSRFQLKHQWGKSKRVKRPAKKSTETPARGVVIRETPEMPLSMKKEKMTIEKHKGIDLLSEVALTEEAQFEEIRKKSMRDFHKTHLSGSSTITKTALSVAKIKPSESDYDESEENKEADDDDEDETKTTDKVEGDEDEEMDFTTIQLYDDVDIRLNEPVDTDKRVTALEKEVVELKEDDPFKTQVTALVDEHLGARIGATKDEFMNFLSSLITRSITKQVKTASDLAKGNKDKDEDPSAGSDQGSKKRKTSKDAESTKGPKAKESESSSSKGDKSKSKSPGKSIQLEEPEFEVADSNMPHDQEENPDNDDEPKEKVRTKHDWFTKPSQPQEPTDPDWNISKTLQQGQNQSWLMTLASSAKKPSKTFDDLMSTPIDFSAFIIDGLNINNLT